MTNKILKPVGKGVKVEPITKEFLLNSFDLTERARDKKIEEVLGENHLFDKGGVYALIGGLIAKQPEGEEGDLLNNGNWNLFYTASYVVSVSWYSSAGRWRVGAWERGDGAWRAGGRVFSPATGS